jgi:hypothetical protein
MLTLSTMRDPLYLSREDIRTLSHRSSDEKGEKAVL